MASRLESNFSLTFPGSIWNLANVTVGSVLVVEIRDDHKRRVSFAAIEITSGRQLWMKEFPEEPWWVSLAHASENVILLQQFDGEMNPDRRTWYCVDTPAFTVRWKHENLALDHVSGDTIAGFVQGEPVLVDLLTGEQQVVSNFEDANEIPDVLRPFQYLEGTPYFETVKRFLGSRTAAEVIGGIEYREWEGMIFISYYLREQDHLANYLLVVREDGELMLTEKLDDGLKGLGVDTFFLLQGCLFYIRNKRELVSYRLA